MYDPKDENIFIPFFKVEYATETVCGPQNLKYLSLVGSKGDFPRGSLVNILPASVRDAGLIRGAGRPPGEGNGNHSSILAWEIPWTEEPGGL